MEKLIEWFRPGGEPIMGKALAAQTDIAKISDAALIEMIKDELGFTREAKLFDQKIEAASDPQEYFKNRKRRQGELAKTVSDFVKAFAGKLREAGFTNEEIGIISRHIVRVLGDIVKIQLDTEFPTEFARGGLEDLLKKNYR